MPTDINGVATYNNSNYNAPVQAIIGMAGFTLDNFTTEVSSSPSPSLSPILLFMQLQFNICTLVHDISNSIALVHEQSNSWSLRRIAEFGYVRVNATKQELYLEVRVLNFKF